MGEAKSWKAERRKCEGKGMSNFIAFGEAGLFDEFMQNLDVAAFETPLMRVGKIVRWEMFEKALMERIKVEAKGPGGRPRFHPLLMFKVLVLQRLHGLAEDATSYQISDRNSFRAFLGLTPGDLVPDGQTISDFRQALIKAGAMDGLFEIFLEHLQKEHGLALAKKGVMIDASFCEVPRQRNSREDNARIKAGEPPGFANNPKVKAHKDLDARWTKKNNESYYGYKDHVKVDVEDKFILKAVITSANVHDSQPLGELVEEGDLLAYADSAYCSEAVNAVLAARNIEARINAKGVRWRPLLSEEEKAANREKSRTRCRVEHVFAQMTGSMKALFQRCIGFERNAACLKLTNLVYNLLRFEQIIRLKLHSPA
jgi:IS5 family transposase